VSQSNESTLGVLIRVVKLINDGRSSQRHIGIHCVCLYLGGCGDVGGTESRQTIAIFIRCDNMTIIDIAQRLNEKRGYSKIPYSLFP